MATANHYWADGMIAGMLVAGVVPFVLVLTDRRAEFARPAGRPPATGVGRIPRPTTTQSDESPMLDVGRDTGDHDPECVSVPGEP